MRKHCRRRRPTAHTIHPAIFAQQAFSAIDRLLDLIQTGEWDYTADSNIPVIIHGDGTCCSMVGALEGWREFWEEVRQTVPFGLSLAPLETFIGYLKRDDPIPPSVIADLVQNIAALKQLYIRMPQKHTALLARRYQAHNPPQGAQP